MDAKLTTSILEIISSSAALFFGLYAALNDTKPKDGKLTKAGKVVVLGIIVSGIMSLTIKSINAYNDRRELARAIEKNKQEQLFKANVNEQLQRSLDSLTSISEKSKTTVSKTMEGLKLQNQNLKKQGVILKYTERQINPLFPLKIGVNLSIVLEKPDYYPYYQMLSVIRDSIEDELYEIEMAVPEKERLNAYFFAKAKYAQRYKIFINNSGSKVLNFVLFDNSSSLLPRQGSNEYNALSKTISLVITKNNVNNLRITDSSNYFYQLKGVSVFDYFKPELAGNAGVQINFGQKATLKIFYSFPVSKIYSNDNDLVSLKDMENCNLVITNPYCTIDEVYLKTGVSFNQTSAIAIGNSPDYKKQYIIRKIVANELGLVK